ncbi:cell division topological specificity factor MinE [Methylobacterium sp. 77]|uniref:cell division topological specificity factor MinE n=1 Tax=Methylobacterium sp. 77 TaxID=1101192 RepID=UPI00036DD5FA|nr:cell division topological specificity factor MinE [Methylobacterium sp. 77]
MSLRNLFNKRASAPTARDRLQLILAHERAGAGGSDLVMLLREEILAVIAKHVTVERDKVQIRLERGQDMSTLGVDIELPMTAPAKPPAKSPAKAPAKPSGKRAAA